MDALQHLVDFIKRKKPDEDPVAYLYRLVEETLDPSERVDFYVESSEHFWREGLELVEKGELRQGSEKIWNSVVQLVKAAAEKKGLKHHTHRLVWATVRKIAMEHDPETITLFAAIEQLHINFYEGHLDKWDVEKLTEAAAKLRKVLFAYSMQIRQDMRSKIIRSTSSHLLFLNPLSTPRRCILNSNRIRPLLSLLYLVI